ncbi:MAG: chemotaxis protein CheX [Thermodesulfobacteriota bacterium]
MLENLKAATFEVLETMFFLFPESWEEGSGLLHGPGIRAWVAIQGPNAFKVGLTVPLKMAQEMVTNFLGITEDQLSPEKVEDVLKEAANMVAGAFLGREGASASFNLMPPQVKRLNLEDEKWEDNGNHVLLAVDDYGMEVFLEKN